MGGLGGFCAVGGVVDCVSLLSPAAIVTLLSTQLITGRSTDEAVALSHGDLILSMYCAPALLPKATYV